MNPSDDMLDPDAIIERLIRESDEACMPIPDIEYEPHVLISKVRKHYMDYLIKLLSMNYETNQKLVNKNIYLPSAIWRCAKAIEMKAAQMCMAVQIYRRHIVSAIKNIKKDTTTGRLNKDLYECLHKPPVNEKKMQTTLSGTNCGCQHSSEPKKKRLNSPATGSRRPRKTVGFSQINQQIITSQDTNHQDFAQAVVLNEKKPNINDSTTVTNLEDLNHQSVPPKRMSTESQDPDDLMVQLEKLFQTDPNDEDLFDGGLYESLVKNGDEKKIPEESDCTEHFKATESVIEDHAARIKSLDDRLALLADMLTNTNENVTDENSANESLKTDSPKPKKKIVTSKWVCEEHFLKSRYFEFMYKIGDSDRKKLARIKVLLGALFGEDSDDEGVVSPLEETPEFVASCKERISPWIVKMLTPHYIRGRIQGKALFKTLAKHLIKLILQCSHYPSEYEVRSFVSDFLENHKMIRCEADYKEFRIVNI